MGFVVHVHPDRKAAVVEFMSLDGDTAVIATVLAYQARSMDPDDSTHVPTFTELLLQIPQDDGEFERIPVSPRPVDF